MNRYHLTWVLCLFLALILASPASGQQADAAVRLEPSSISLGPVGHGMKKVLQFSIINQTKSMVQISQIRPTCGCMKMRPHDIRTPLAPMETRSFQVDLSLGRGWGQFAKKIAITVGGQPPLYLPVDAQFHPGFKVSALEMVLATATGHQIPESKSSIQILHVNGTQSPEITDLRSSDPAFKASISAKMKDRVVIELEATGELPPGRFAGKVEGMCNGLPFMIPYRGRSFQEVVYSPQSWNLNQIKKAGFCDKTLILRSADGKPLKVISCRVELSRLPDGLDISVTPERKDDGSVEIRAYAADPFPLKSGGIYGKVTIQLDHPKQKEVVVDLLGVVRVGGR